MIFYAILFVSILIGVIGQLVLKHSTLVTPKFEFLHPMFNEYFMVAVGLYGISFVLYTISLKQIPLTIAFPSVSLSYFMVALASHYIWQTNFGWKEIVALVFILIGVTLLVDGSGVR